MFFLAKKACLRAQVEPEESLTAILLSAVSFECFLNEFESIADDLIGPTDSSQLQLLRDILSDLEKGKAHIRTKVKAIHFFITLQRLDFGQPPYQDLLILIEIRNALVHRKPEKFEIEINNPGKKYEPHRLVKFLADRKIIKRPPNSNPSLFSEILMKPEVAKWAYDTAALVIKDICIKIPKSRFADRIHFMARTYTDRLNKLEKVK